jgi:hypothetical protein
MDVLGADKCDGAGHQAAESHEERGRVSVEETFNDGVKL